MNGIYVVGSWVIFVVTVVEIHLVLINISKELIRIRKGLEGDRK
jgi:hypothetical protein